LIHGVIQHDVYHAGQIGLIKKAAKAMRSEEDDNYGAYGDRSDYDNSADYY